MHMVVSVNILKVRFVQFDPVLHPVGPGRFCRVYATSDKTGSRNVTGCTRLGTPDYFLLQIRSGRCQR